MVSPTTHPLTDVRRIEICAPPPVEPRDAGHCGYLHLGFEREADGRTILRDLERRVPIIVQQALYFDEQMPQMPCVYILSSGGPTLEGDRHHQIFHLRRAAEAHIATGAASKIAVMSDGYATMRQEFIIEDDAYLEYLPEPTIPSRDARYKVTTSIRIAPSATAVYAEIYMSGRRHHAHGERFEYDALSLATEVRNFDDKELYREKYFITPALFPPQRIGAMGRCDVFGTATILTLPHLADKIYSRITPQLNSAHTFLSGITRLPNDCGLAFRVMSEEASEARRTIRSVCSVVRQVVKGHTLPDEFPWR